MMGQHLSSLIFIMLLGISSSCAETPTQTQSKESREKSSDNKKANTKKTDDRGFDPCLFNSNLPVCKDNKASNNVPSK